MLRISTTRLSMRTLGSPSVRPVTAAESVAKRFFGSQAAPFSPSSVRRFQCTPILRAGQAAPQQEMHRLCKAGLELLGIESDDLARGLAEFGKGFNVEIFPQSEVQQNLKLLLYVLNRFDPSIQSELHVEDIDELMCFIRFKYTDLTQWLPSLESPHPDATGCFNLIEKYFDRGRTLLLDDGAGSGSQLLQWVKELQDKGSSYYALGTDINNYTIALARMKAREMELDAACRFAPAHVLYRPSSHQIAQTLHQTVDRHITMACRMIPVLTESKICRYFQKLSREMGPRDLWCGSIALPEGEFYERNTKDQRAIAQGHVRALDSKIGVTTFVHRPEGITESSEPVVLAKARDFGLSWSREDVRHHVNNVILNSYMKRDAFETLIRSYGFKLVEAERNPHTVNAPSTNYLCILLEKNS